MMVILKRGIDAILGESGLRAFAARTGGTFAPDGQGSRQSWPDADSEERSRPHRSEEMFYWGMAGGPWY